MFSPGGAAAPRGENRSWRLAAVVGGVLLFSFPAAAAAPAPAPARVLYRFADGRIDEASGIGVGVRSPGIDYVQNDSGDSARFFAIDAATGRTAATVTVPGATDVDWEDLAVAPGPPGSAAAGRSSVWLGDIGDNDAVRSEIRVYRVDEPRIAAGDRDRRLRAARPDIWRLRYPDGPVNAESLAVTPTGTAYVVTKSVLGSSVVYRLPRRPDAEHVQTLVRVGTITFSARRTTTPLGVIGTLTATGAALSPDGSLLAVRTYADAFVWRVRDDDVAGALTHAPVRVPLPVEPQGEGVAFGGTRLLVDSEGARTPVYAVPLPATLTTRPRASVPPASVSPAPSSRSAVPTSAQPSATTAGGDSSSPSDAGPLVAGAVGGLLLVAAAVAWRRRRAR